jgi:hypothetical protein
VARYQVRYLTGFLASSLLLFRTGLHRADGLVNGSINCGGQHGERIWLRKRMTGSINPLDL